MMLLSTLYQHDLLDFKSTSSLVKQPFAGRHIASLLQIISISSQPAFALIP
jgi:hypothetical protein